MRFLIAGILGLALFASPAQAEMPKVGDPAPDFEMVGTDGKTYRLADFRGKQAVVVAWYPRAFTGGCTRECISLREGGEKLRKFDVAYFTASTDPVQKNKEFAESLELDYPILSDPEGRAARAYGIYNAERDAARRVTFIIGEDGKLLHVDEEVRVGDHAADIVAKLKELGVEER